MIFKEEVEDELKRLYDLGFTDVEIGKRLIGTAAGDLEPAIIAVETNLDIVDESRLAGREYIV